jgi:hypothetical protein
MLFIAPPANAAAIGSGSCTSTANSDANVVVASGSGYCYVAFKGTGTNSWTAPAGTTSADFLIVAGGGSGGSGAWGGGGGAGGVVFYSGYSVSSSSATQLNVGVGGTPGTAYLDPAANRSGNGGNSWVGSVSAVVAIGGGAGASYAYGSTSANSSGSSGGSGGGATENTSTNNGGASTQTLPSGAAIKYGNAGGATANAAHQSGGGGGGAGAVGGAVTGSGVGGAGGAGTNAYATYVNLFSVGVSGFIAGGGGGGTNGATGALGGSSVGGLGGASGSLTGGDGAANTGSGAGGASYSGISYQGGAGGTGLIIVRYARALVSVTNITSSSADGEYATGDTLNISVTFSETLTVTGSPLLPLETGNTDANATYVSGSGSPTLTFTYVIQANRGSPDLTVPSATSMALNGGTIVDSLGVTPYLYLQKYLSSTVGSLSYNKNISFNTVKVTNVTSTSANGNYSTGEVINIQVQLSGSATYTCGGDLSLRSQTLSAQNATVSSGSGTSTLNYSYTVQSADYATDLDYAYTTSLRPAGCNTLKDANGVEITYTLPSPGAIGSLAYNKNISLNIPVTTVSLALVSGGAAAAYRATTPVAATVSVAGKVRFFVNGKKIPGCTGVSSMSLISTCNWRPSNHGTVLLQARLTPTNVSFEGSNSSLLSVFVSRRSASRQ